MLQVSLAPEAAEAVVAAVQRELPHEVAVYPLAALLPDAQAAPLEDLDPLEASGDLVLTSVLAPPPDAADFGPAHARFLGAQAAAASAALRASAEAVVARHARLAFLCKVHSHPHPGGDFLSGGDLYHNVLQPRAQAWWRGRGLGAALMLVAYPRASAALPAALQASPWGPSEEQVGGSAGAEEGDGAAWQRGDLGATWQGWSIACFVASWGGAVHRVDDARLLAPDSALLGRALSPPFWQGPEGREWSDANKAALRAAGWEVSRNGMVRGWQRYLLRRPGRAPQVLCLPPDFPAAPARLFEVADARRDAFRLLRTVSAPDLASCRLLEVVA